MLSTLEQSVVTDRRNRTLVDIVRSMMNTCNLLEFHWGEAPKVAVYVLNGVMKTPFEFYGPTKN